MPVQNFSIDKSSFHLIARILRKHRHHVLLQQIFRHEASLLCNLKEFEILVFQVGTMVSVKAVYFRILRFGKVEPERFDEGDVFRVIEYLMSAGDTPCIRYRIR